MTIDIKNCTIPIDITATQQQVERLQTGLLLMGLVKHETPDALEGMLALVTGMLLIATVYRAPGQTDENMRRALHHTIDRATDELLPVVHKIARAIEQAQAQQESGHATTH